MRVRKKTQRPTMAQLILLASLPGTVCDLADRCETARDLITRTANYCVQKNWIKRTRQGRFVRLEITSQGQKVVADFRAMLDNVAQPKS